MINRKDHPAAGTGGSIPSVEKTEDPLVDPQPKRLMEEADILDIEQLSPINFEYLYHFEITQSRNNAFCR